jgi:phage terminase large subunit
LFKTGNLFINENCVNLIQEIRRYKWAKARNHTQNLKETPVDKDNHAIDALLYAVAFIEGLSPRVGGEDAMKYTIKYYAERKTQDTRENIA